MRHRLGLFIISLCLLGPAANATPVPPACHVAYEADRDLDHRIADRLRSEPPARVDLRQVGRALNRMRRDLDPIRKGAREILRNEQDYIAGQASREQAVERAQGARKQLGDMAQQLMNTERLSPSARRQLEGIQVLRNRTRRVESHSPQELAEISGEDSKTDRPPVPQSKPKPQPRPQPANRTADDSKSSADQEKESSHEDADRDDETGDGPERTEEKTTRRSESKSEEPSEAPQKQKPQETKPKKSEDAAEKEGSSDKGPEGQPDEKPSQSTAKSKDGAEKDKSASQAQPSSAGTESTEGDSSGAKAGEGSKQESDGNKKGDGESSRSKANTEGSGSSDSSAPGESNNEGHAGDEFREGDDGLKEGGLGADQSFLQKLKDHFRNALETGPTKSESTELKKRELEKRKPNVDGKLTDWEDRAREKKTPAARQDPKTQSKPVTERDQKRDQKRSPLAINSTQEANLLNTLLSRLQVQALRNYRNSEHLDAGLSQLQTTAASMSGENRGSDSIRQQAADLREVREGLEAYQIKYKSLENLGLASLSTIDGGGKDALRRVHFVNDLLTNLGKRATLTDQENRVLKIARRLIEISESGEKPGDKDLCEAFLKQLMGPLARKVVLSEYRSEGSKDGYDWAGMARAIRGDRYNDLLIHSALAPYMNMLLNTSMKPKSRREPNGERVTVNERDPGLEQADELDRFQSFYRDGAPTQVDLLRFLSGDMLESVYRDEVVKNDPKVLHPKKVTYILYDVSGSMGSKNKFVLRNALILAYLDRAQREVVTGESEHVIYTMAFDGDPHEPERIAGIAQAQAAFERMRSQPLSAGGDDSISGALIDVYRRIAAQQAEGGELNRANILLLTDAVAPVEFAKIEEARKKITGEVDVRLNAITMGDLNKDVTKLVELSGGEGRGKLGTVTHQHIDYTQVASLLNAKTRLEVMNRTAGAFKSTDRAQLTNNALLEFKNRLVALEAGRSADDTSKLPAFQGLIRLLRSSGTSKPDEAVTKVFTQYRRLAMSSTSTGWSQAEKLESFWSFATDLAKETGANGEEVVGRMTNEQLDAVRSWTGV